MLVTFIEPFVIFYFATLGLVLRYCRVGRLNSGLFSGQNGNEIGL